MPTVRSAQFVHDPPINRQFNTIRITPPPVRITLPHLRNTSGMEAVIRRAETTPHRKKIATGGTECTRSFVGSKTQPLVAGNAVRPLSVTGPTAHLAT